MSYQDVGKWLSNLFLDTLYPAIVFTLLIYLIGILITLIFKGRNLTARIRRTTGAVLPIFVLVIMMGTYREAIKDIEQLYGQLLPIIQFIFGALIGAVLMESGRHFLRTDNDGLASLHALFISFIFSFMLWSIMGGVLQSFNVTLIGLAIGGGLHIIFRKPVGNDKREG